MELVELGFSKSLVTRVRRQLREKKTASGPKIAKGRSNAKRQAEPSLTSPAEMAPIQQKLVSVESEIRGLETRVKALEALGSHLEDVEDRLNATPAVGLGHRFTYNCGASGFVALHIRCTKCGRETWWGWFPKT